MGTTHATRSFTPDSGGDHFFTLHCPSVVYGDSILATANVTLQAPGGAALPVISWPGNRNKPATLSGRISGLEIGVEYEVNLACENCCVPFHKDYDAGDLQLFVTRPRSEQTIRSQVADYIDYYVVVPSSSTSSETSLFDACIDGYRTLTGIAPLLPKWTYGFWQSKEHYANRTELLTAAHEFRDRGIPVDAIVQDWKYWGDLGWSPQWD